MRTINIAEVDPNLLADIAGSTDPCFAYESACPNAGFNNDSYHVVFCPDARRAGIVFVGSGSSGETFWTDADSPEEALSRYLSDDMRP